MADAKISALVDGATALIDTDLLVYVDVSAGGAGTKKAVVSALSQSLGWYNVKTYGATGDGVTNDTAAIHSTRDAAGANGTVYFPAGTYLVSTASTDTGALLASVAGQRWVLASGATIKLAGAQNNQVQVIRITAAGVRIEGPGKIDGNRAAQTQSSDMNGIEVRADDCTVQGVQVTGARTAGIEVFSAVRCKVLYNWVTLCSSNGVFVRRAAEETLVHGNTVTDCDNDPIIAHSQVAGSAPHGTIISNNHLECDNASAFGVECGAFSGDRPSGLQVVNNRIIGIVAHFGAISMAGCDDAVVSGNTYDDNGVEGGIGGIEIAGCTNTTVVGNTLVMPLSAPGIVLDASSRCIVEGNVVNGWKAEANSAAIEVSSSSASESVNYNIVKGNTCIASSGSAVDAISLFTNAASVDALNNIIEGNILIGLGVASSRAIVITRFSGSGTVADTIVRGNQMINWPTAITLNGAAGTHLRTTIGGNKYTTITTRLSTQTSVGPTILEDDLYTPAALASGNTNDYAAICFGLLRMSADAAGSTLTGVAGGLLPQHRLRIVNISANTLTIAHEDANSTAANRFTSPTGASVALGQNDYCEAVYDDVSSRWRIVGVLT